MGYTGDNDKWITSGDRLVGRTMIMRVRWKYMTMRATPRKWRKGKGGCSGVV